MAVGFTPKYEVDFPLEELNKAQFLALVHEAITKLDWQLRYLSEVGLMSHTGKGMFSWNADIKVVIEGGVAHLKSSSAGSDLFDLGKNKKTITQLVSTLKELKQALSPDDLLSKYEHLKEEFPTKEEDILQLPPATAFDGLLSMVLPMEGYFITPLLLVANIAIFVCMVATGMHILSPESEDLLKWGANFRPLIVEGDLWRLFTCCFLHIGVIHLLMNMYALMYIGVLLEPHLGKSKFLFAYLISGITASVTSVWWHSYTVSAGASGAIFGMYGVFLALLTTDFMEKSQRNALLSSVGIFVGYNLLYGMTGSIDNAAHIGGLLSGILIGYAFVPSLKKPSTWVLSVSTLVVVAVVLLGLSFVVSKNLKDELEVYKQKIVKFDDMEKMALEVYNLPPDTPKEDRLYGLNQRGIYYWKENIKLLDELDGLDLPEAYKEYDKKLKSYCELRIKSYELMSKAVAEDTDQYQIGIESYDKQITAAIESLK